MADSRGNSQALNFALPENRYIQPQQTEAIAPQEAVNPLPQMGNDNFAYVEGITDKFYNLKGQVEKYALDMSKKYGVDVTQPDYTQPGGGALFKTYQKLATDLMLTANDLKESQKINTQNLAAERSGQITRQAGFDPTQQLSSRTAPDEMFFTNNLLPEVEQANRLLATQTYTDADHNRISREVLQPTIDKINARTDISEQQKQFNINALVQQAKTTPYAAFQGQNNGRSEKQTAIVDFYKRVNNQVRGAFDPANAELLYDPETLKPFRASGELGGTSLGKKAFVVKGQKKEYPLTIDKIITTGDGKSFVSFVQPEEAIADEFVIPDEEITGTKTDLFIKRMITNDSRLGIKQTELIDALKKAQLYTDTGSKDSEAVTKEFQNDLKVQTENLDKAKNELLKKLKEAKKGIRIPIETTSGGQTIEVLPYKKSLFGSDVEYGIVVDGHVVSEKLDEKGVQDWIAQNGEYFSKALNSSATQEAPTEKVNVGGKKLY